MTFIHRPEYFGLTEDESGNSLLGVAEIIIAKHRNGATADVHLRFRKELAKFTDMDPQFEKGGFNNVKTYGSSMNMDDDSYSEGMARNSGFDSQSSSSSNVPF